MLSKEWVMCSGVKEVDMLNMVKFHDAQKFKFKGLGQDNSCDGQRVQSAIINFLSETTGDDIFCIKLNMIANPIVGCR